MGDLTRALGMTRTPSSYLGKRLLQRVSSYWEVSSYSGRKREKQGQYHPLVAMIHTLRTKSLSIAVRTMAVKTAKSFPCPWSMSSLSWKCCGGKLHFLPLSFSTFCGYLDNDQGEALPKLLSLSPSLSVYLPPDEDAHSSGWPFKRNISIQWLQNVHIIRYNKHVVNGKTVEAGYYLWKADKCCCQVHFSSSLLTNRMWIPTIGKLSRSCVILWAKLCIATKWTRTEMS